MSVSLIIFIIIHLGIFTFTVELLRRIAYRSREYPLEETRDTLPFGFLRLQHVAILFVLIYIAWVVFSIWLYNTFIGF